MKLKSVGSLISLTINLDLIKEQKIKYLKYGATHLVFVTNYGDVFVYGNNSEGQIGLGEVENVTEIVKIKNINFGEIKFLECHEWFTIIVNDFNRFYFTGLLGKKIFKNNEFKKLSIKFFDKIKSIHCGGDFVIILTTEHCIYGFGENYEGQLGLQRIEICKTFKKINVNFKVKNVKCGFFHTILLDFNDNIYVTGFNYYGQLGLGNYWNMDEFTKVELPFKVIKIFSSTANTFILSEKNELFGTGYNKNGALGVGDCEGRVGFTKVKNCNGNVELVDSFNDCNCVVNDNNEIFISGKTSVFVLNNTNVFTKLNIDNSNNYIYPLLMKKNIFIFYCDYKINEVLNCEEQNTFLKTNLLQKLQMKQLADVEFI